MVRMRYYLTRFRGKLRISTSHKKRGTILYDSDDSDLLENMKQQLDVSSHWKLQLRSISENKFLTENINNNLETLTAPVQIDVSQQKLNIDQEIDPLVKSVLLNGENSQKSSDQQLVEDNNFQIELVSCVNRFDILQQQLNSDHLEFLATEVEQNSDQYEKVSNVVQEENIQGENLQQPPDNDHLKLLTVEVEQNLDLSDKVSNVTQEENIQAENLQQLPDSDHFKHMTVDIEQNFDLSEKVTDVTQEENIQRDILQQPSNSHHSETSAIEVDQNFDISEKVIYVTQETNFRRQDYISSDELSNEEPFQESEDEYIPNIVSDSLSDATPEKKRKQKQNKISKFNKIRRKLFSKDLHLQETLTSSTIESSSDDDSRKTMDIGLAREQVGNVARDLQSQQALTSSTVESSSDDDSRKTIDIGLLRVQEGNVAFKLNETLHLGNLYCELTKVGTGDLLLTFVRDERKEKHTCVYSEKRECLFMRNNCNGELSAKICIPPCTLEGTEHPMGKNYFVASLSDIKSKFIDVSSKKHYCVFCGVMRKHITDHLKKVHGHEEEVQKAQNLPSKSKEKVKIFKKLRNLGDRLHDSKVLPEKRIPARRPTKTNISEFLCCETCNSLISPLNFARHDRKCTNRIANYRHILREKKKEISNKAMKVDSAIYDKLLDELLSPLQDDEISHLIRCDTALRAFARHYCVSGHMRENKGKNTRMQLLRLLARLFEWIQLLDESILEFKDTLVPEKYDVLIEAVLRLTEANFKTGSINKSSTCLLLKSCIKNLAEILKLHYLQLAENERYIEDITNLTNFISVHESRYKEDLNKIAYESRANARAIKNIKLPTVSDVHKFTEFVERIAISSFNFLECKGFDYKQWLNLGKSVLILLLVFNRRRIGETSKMRIELYHQREKVNAEDRKHMNRLELLLADRFSVMKLIAKRVRQLTILLTDQHIRYLDMFLKYRSNAGVSDDNPYLFGVPNNIQYLDASDAIRKYSEKCGAEEPKTLRATLFRKQVATLSQMLQLSDNEIQQLADFMGHKVEVHKKYYRSPAAVQEITVLSKFFMAVGDDNIGRFRGKSLSDLEVLIENDMEATDNNANGQETDISNVDVPVEETSENVVSHAQQEISAPSSSHFTHDGEAFSDLHTERSKRPKSRSPKKTPQKTPAHTMEHLLNFVIKKSPRRVSFSKAEKDLIYQYFGKYIQNGTYPPKQMEQYGAMLKKHEDIFHKKRTIRHIYSFMQYRIKAARESKK